MRIAKHVLFMLLLLTALPCSTYGQQYSVRILDGKHGLPSFEINSTFVDKHGYTWIATQDGLCRWNGRRIETFLPSLGDSTSILNQRCYTIHECSDGTLQFSSINGISTFDKGRQAFQNWSPNGDRNSTALRGSPLKWINDSLASFWAVSG
ncbi:MAG: hypothetical protein NTX15_01060, partial [Candidatus Kapabacteria bacterium]|nr:hypothetical protein [Candidatus Kapabacteria bacterium]